MNIILTKSMLDLSETIHKLSRLHHEVLPFSLLNVHALDDANWIDIRAQKRHYQAILFTSRYAVLSFVRLIKDKPELSYFYTIPVHVVGGKTAAYAIELGFESVLSSCGTAQDLAYLLSEKGLDPSFPILYVSGKDICFNFETFFTMAGYAFDRLIVYKTIGAQRMPMNILGKFLTRWVEGILFYSPKGAETFIQLAKKYDLNLKKTTAFCISRQVAEKLSCLSFYRKKTAPYPSEDSLLYLLRPTRW